MRSSEWLLCNKSMLKLKVSFIVGHALYNELEIIVVMTFNPLN